MVCLHCVRNWEGQFCRGSPCLKQARRILECYTQLEKIDIDGVVSEQLQQETIQIVQKALNYLNTQLK